MIVQEFIAKWKKANLSERSAAQQHFLDLCELLNQPKPAAADPEVHERRRTAYSVWTARITKTKMPPCAA